MVAIIKTSHSIQHILNYNENKVKAGVAECISAEKYPIDLEKLNFTLKLNRSLKLAQLNENAKRNTVHISLNFDTSENHSKEKLIEISNVYMQKIGFGKQPYLVYEHQDAGHPHVHIVTNNIQRDGKRIDLHLLGIRKSEPARKEIEELFGLVKAQDRKVKEPLLLTPISTPRINYGKVESKKAISTILNFVVNEYKYTSLPELNAVLKQYNVLADRGKEDSRVFKNNGILYKILDKNGKTVGVPIKASDFYTKPTLKNLEGNFKLNKVKRTKHQAYTKNEIDKILQSNKQYSLDSFVSQLQSKGIHAELRKSSEGQLYGITYIDHRTKCVFNGSALGKQYSAKAIVERCLSENKNEKLQLTDLKLDTSYQILNGTSNLEKGLEILFKPEQNLEGLSEQQRNKKKKKSKRKGFILS
ncbi:relaxase/mobilization nuclease domain-containing protein [Flavobacterium sp. TAB 87]|uniref:relaxase/mobilization nuclease domain-containing protein n=1 Tax=Flavobacterium sp. TAB 87 TaxID=1729581 RepID=UPI00076D4609|nr:relaxase/mobilization nuclease domain-containing protein [Flavobacterium sp. TAB 87]KVV14374.1 Relaxase/mobilization nuclease domain protein [Flavobacterium sp. TAB 87]